MGGGRRTGVVAAATGALRVALLEVIVTFGLPSLVKLFADKEEK